MPEPSWAMICSVLQPAATAHAGASTRAGFQAEPPPAGLADVMIWPRSSTATHNVVAGQETALIVPVPVIALTVHAPLPPVGVPDVTTPEGAPPTHSDEAGQLKRVNEVVPTWVNCHAGSPPDGLVELSMSPVKSPATHRLGEAQATPETV